MFVTSALMLRKQLFTSSLQPVQNLLHGWHLAEPTAEAGRQASMHASAECVDNMCPQAHLKEELALLLCDLAF